MDAPCVATIGQSQPVTPSTLRASVPSSTSSSSKLSPASDSDSDDGLEESDLKIRSLRPTSSSHFQRQSSSHSQRQHGYLKSTSHSQNADRSSHKTVDFCGLCNMRGHPDWRCMRRGPAFWTPVHARKVEQYNLIHGTKPTPDQLKLLQSLSPPPPSNPSFLPPSTPWTSNKYESAPSDKKLSLRTIQSAIEEQTGILEDQLTDTDEGIPLKMRAMAIRRDDLSSQSPSELAANLKQFDVTDEDGSAHPLDASDSDGSDGSLAHDDLELYAQRLN